MMLSLAGLAKNMECAGWSCGWSSPPAGTRISTRRALGVSATTLYDSGLVATQSRRPEPNLNTGGAVDIFVCDLVVAVVSFELVHPIWIETVVTFAHFCDA